jgi:hypothetical protein
MVVEAVTYPWEAVDAPEHVRVRQPVMEIRMPAGVRRDLPVRRRADTLPTSLCNEDFGIVVMCHRGSSNGRLSVLLSSIPENYPVTVSSDSVSDTDVELDEEVCDHHGAVFAHCTPWGGRARNAIHCMEVTSWKKTLFLCDDVWLFPETVSDALRWACVFERHDLPLASLGIPGRETYRDHPLYGFNSWEECLEKPWLFELLGPVPEMVRAPALYKNPFGACMLLIRSAYDDLGGFSPDYWAHDDVYTHKVWTSGKYVCAAHPGRGYMHIGAQSWHHGESVEYVNTFEDGAGMSADDSGALQVAAIYEWVDLVGDVFVKLGGQASL